MEGGKMKVESRKWKDIIEPYLDIIIFMVTLVVTNYFWKFTVIGDEHGDTVSWFGIDLTSLFDVVSNHVAAVVFWLVSLFRDTVYMVDANTIRFNSGSGTSIVWGCTGIKQSFIFLWLILTVRPYALRFSPLRFQFSVMSAAKLLYIPFGWLCCYLFNILRIFCITVMLEYHPLWFLVLHDVIFKYLFYFMLFGLWVLFVERIRPAVLERLQSSKS